MSDKALLDQSRRRFLQQVSFAVVGSATVGQLAFASGPVAITNFTGTHQIAYGRLYTKQTVKGSLSGVVPSSVSVIDYHGATIQFAAKPKLSPAFWNGYFKTTYHLDAWDLGKNANAQFHLMLPDSGPGATFTALLVSEFLVGGNWQNWIPCTNA